MGYLINKNTWILTGMMIFSLVLSGCAAVHTSIAKKDLDVQTKMSDSIFLDPVEPSQKTVYLNIRNTSDKTNFDITGTVARALEGRGYRITNNPKEAHYWLQVNILSVDKAIRLRWRCTRRRRRNSYWCGNRRLEWCRDWWIGWRSSLRHC